MVHVKAVTLLEFVRFYPGTKKTLNGESGSKSFLPDEKGKEKAVFLVKRVKPAEPCEQCGSLAVEHEITKPTGEKLRKCPDCFEKFKQERANVEWREEDWPA
jgi:hypothetical protein